LGDRKRLFYLIGISTIFRFILSCCADLSNVEAYYWSFSTNLQWNYFDHPPVVAWLIRLTTANLLLHNVFFVRLGAVVCAAICTFLIFEIGTLIHQTKTGWIAALLYTSSLYSSFLVGMYILPDSPQMVFWLLSILILLRIVKENQKDATNAGLWVLFGISSGLCIMCKAHGIFLWVGLVLFVLLFKKSWLKNKNIYIAALVSLIISSPILIWNAENDFASVHFHGGRIIPTSSGVDLVRFLKNMAFVVVVFNPLNFIMICGSLIWLAKKKIFHKDEGVRLILCCSLPLIVLLFLISLFRETYPHWSGPGYSLLLILPALWITSDPKRTLPVIPKQIIAALVFTVVMMVSEIVVTNYFPGTTSDTKDGITIGIGDISLDMYGWKKMASQFDSIYQSDLLNKRMPVRAPIIITKWYPASHIDFYMAHLTNQVTIGMGDITDLHQYFWTNRYKKALKTGDSTYYLVPSNEFDSKELNRVVGHFKSYSLSASLPQYRNGVLCRELYVFKMFGFNK
jgi:4-amino-4-deoxy-L-arabinose transferase-like glycosyltransferase